MKKLALLLPFCLAVSLSCTKSGQESLTLSAALPCSLSRLAPGDETDGVYPLTWEAGDRISIGSRTSQPLSASAIKSDKANFVFLDFAGAAPYHVLYPASETGEVVFDGSVPPMYASASSLSGAVQFHHAGCALRLNLSGDLKVSSLSLRADGGEPVAGRFNINFNTGELDALAALPLVTTAPGKPLSALSGTVFYLYFVPGTFSEGLTVTAESPDGFEMSWHLASGATLGRGRVYLLPDLCFRSLDFTDGARCSLEEMSETLISMEL